MLVLGIAIGLVIGANVGLVTFALISANRKR